MNIEFDPNKDKINVNKHGFSLADAKLVEWATLWEIQDTRRDYGEIRMIGYAYIGMRLMCVVYTDREETRRIISLRKAAKSEIKRYAKA